MRRPLFLQLILSHISLFLWTLFYTIIMEALCVKNTVTIFLLFRTACFFMEFNRGFYRNNLLILSEDKKWSQISLLTKRPWAGILLSVSFLLFFFCQVSISLLNLSWVAISSLSKTKKEEEASTNIPAHGFLVDIAIWGLFWSSLRLMWLFDKIHNLIHRKIDKIFIYTI